MRFSLFVLAFFPLPALAQNSDPTQVPLTRPELKRLLARKEASSERGAGRTSQATTRAK